MPVVLRVGPYRFYFFSNENQMSGEAPHIHVDSSRGYAEYWLVPISCRYHAGYNRAELGKIERIVEAHRFFLLEKWHEFFGRR